MIIKLNANRPKPHEWKKQYEAVLLELDPNKLMALIALAETAISYRLRTLSTGPEGQEERLEIEDAVTAIFTIKNEMPN